MQGSVDVIICNTFPRHLEL